MSIGSAKGMLARVKKLERTRGASADMRDWITQAFDAALADGRMCGMDGPVVKHCLLKWLCGGTARGIAREGVLLWN